MQYLILFVKKILLSGCMQTPDIILQKYLQEEKVKTSVLGNSYLHTMQNDYTTRRIIRTIVIWMTKNICSPFCCDKFVQGGFPCGLAFGVKPIEYSSHG